MSKYDYNTRVIDLTLGELLDAIEERLCGKSESSTQLEADGAPRYVYGLKGIADLLGVSKTTAQRLKSSGKYDFAITQIGATIITNADMFLKLAKQYKQNKKK